MADDDDLSAGELEALIASQMALMDETDDTDMFSMEIPHSSHEDEADEGGMDDLFGELMESNKRTEVEDIGLEDVGGWQAPDGSVGVVEATAAPVVVCEESLAKYSKPAAVLPEIRLVMGLLVDAVEEGQTSSMERSASQALMSIDMAVVQAAADSAKADYKLFDESRFDVAAAVAVEKSPDDTAIELVVNNFFGADDMMRKEEARKQDVAKALGEVEGPLNMRDDEHELMIEEERKRRQERKKRREAEAARYRRIRSAVMMQRVLRGCMGRARVGVMIDDKLAAEAERLAEEAARDEMQTAELRCWTAWDLALRREEAAFLAAEEVVSLCIVLARRGEDENLTQMAVEDIASRALGPRSPRVSPRVSSTPEAVMEVEGGVLPPREAFGFDDELDESMAAEGSPSSSSSSLERNSVVPPLQLAGVSNNDEHQHEGHEEENDDDDNGDNEEEDELSQEYGDESEYVATQEGPVEESQEEGGELDEWRRQDDPEQPFELDPSLQAGWLELVRNNQHHLGAEVEFAQNLEFDSGNKFPRGVDRSAFGGDGAEDMVDEDHPLLLAHLVWRENYSTTTDNFQSTAEGGGGGYAADADAVTAAAAAGGRGDLLLDPSSSLAVDLSVENLTDLSMLKDATSLRKLDVSVNKLCSFDDVAHLSRLVEIAARDNVLESVQALAQLPGLKVLGLDTNHLTDLDALQDLPQLATLAARMNRLSIFPQLPASLERLELYHNQLTHVPSERLACLRRLTYLDLGRNKLTVIDGAALSQCQSLTHLVLSQNMLTQVPCPLHLPVLRSLWLSGNQLQSLSAWEPTDLDECPVFLPLLEKLYLQDNNIDAVPMKVGQLLPSLVALDISFNAIASSDGLLGLRECRALKSANVQDNPVTANADPAPWLRVLCPTLEEVNGRRGAAEVMAGGHALGFNSFGRWRQAVTFDASTDPPLRGAQLGVALQRSLTTTTPDHGGATGEPAPVATSALENFLNSSLDVDLTADGVRVGDLVEMHRDRARLASAFMADPSTVETLRAVVPSAPLRRFMHFLSLLVLKQNVFRARTAGEGHAYLQSLEELRTEMAQWCSEDDDGMLLPCTPVFVDLAVEEPTDAQTSGVGVVKAGGLVAVTKLQAVFRGVLARVKVRNAFGDIRYQDDELDAMFNDNDDLDDMLGDMGVVPSSKKPPSGADGGSEDGDGEGNDGGDSSRPSTTGGPAELKDGWLASTASGQLFSSSVVYGDHRRRKSSAPDSRQGMDAGEASGIPGIEMTPADGDFFPGSEPDPGPEPEPEQEPASGSPPGPPPQPRAPLGVIRTGSNLSLSDGLTVRPLMPAPAPLVTPAPPPSLGLRGDEGGASDVRPSHGGRILSQALPPLTGRSTDMDMDMDDALDDDLDARLPRPLSAMSEISGLSMDSRARSEQGGRSMPADLSPRSQYTDSSLGGHSGGSKAVQQERAVAEEWGINDPTVLAAMMKRNRRLKSFQKQATDRDSNKSAQVRYDKFLKATTGGSGGGNALSGAAGGAKRSGRSAMQSKGSFGGAPKTFRPTGGKAKKSKSVPAWKLGTDAHDDAA